jgi:hypothetical protein
MWRKVIALSAYYIYLTAQKGWVGIGGGQLVPSDTFAPLSQAATSPLANSMLYQKCAIIEAELSSTTHPTGMLRDVAETADGGLKPPRLVASPVAIAEAEANR